MADEKPVTKSDLVAALKAFGQQVKKDVADVVHQEVSEFFVARIQPEFDKLRGEMQDGFKKVDLRLDTLETDVHFIKDNAKGLDAELAMKPTKKRVNKLEQRVDHLEKFHSN